MAQQEIVQRIEPSSVVSPMDMLHSAVLAGASIETLEKLMGMSERWEANQARKSFNVAISLAKSEIPPIVKDSEVNFNKTNYKFETLAGIARVVDPILHKNGLDYRYRSEQNGHRLRVVCVLSHRDGYSEETSLECAEDQSGNKNAIQAVGSAATYLQRYTLKLALGLSTTLDDDGRATSIKTAPQIDGQSVESQLELIKANGKRIAIEEGMTALGTWWTKDLTAQQRKELGPVVLNELKALAEGAI